MGPIITIETCKALTSSPQFKDTVPAAATIAPFLEKIPAISHETKAIFESVMNGTYKSTYNSDIPKFCDLRGEFTKLHLRIQQYETKRDSKAPTFGGAATAVASGIGFLVLKALGFDMVASVAIPLLPAAALGVYLDASVNENHAWEIGLHFGATVGAKKHVQAQTIEFAAFFQDRKVVATLKTAIATVIQKMAPESIQRKVYDRALQELEACRDFCTVYANH